MATKIYEKDGKKLCQVFVNTRSKVDPRLRIQITVTDLKSLSLARREESRIHQELGKKLKEREGQCDTWEAVIEKWRIEAQSGFLGSYNPSTILDHIASLNKWTKTWLKVPASELGKAHGRDLIKK